MVYYKKRLWIYGGSQGRHVLFGDLFSFDLGTNTWYSEECTYQEYPKRRVCHSAHVIDNCMYVYGGIVSDDEHKNQRTTSDMFRLDLWTLCWTRIGDDAIAASGASSGGGGGGALPPPRCCHGSVALDGLIVVVCGGDMINSLPYEYDDFDNGVYAYEARKGKWVRIRTTLISKSLPHCIGLSVVLDPVGKQLLCFGGKLKAGTVLSSLLSITPNRGQVDPLSFLHKKAEQLFTTRLLNASGNNELVRSESLEAMKLDDESLDAASSRGAKGKSVTIVERHTAAGRAMDFGDRGGAGASSAGPSRGRALSDVQHVTRDVDIGDENVDPYLARRRLNALAIDTAPRKLGVTPTTPGSKANVPVITRRHSYESPSTPSLEASNLVVRGDRNKKRATGFLSALWPGKRP